MCSTKIQKQCWERLDNNTVCILSACFGFHTLIQIQKLRFFLGFSRIKVLLWLDWAYYYNSHSTQSDWLLYAQKWVMLPTQLLHHSAKTLVYAFILENTYKEKENRDHVLTSLFYSVLVMWCAFSARCTNITWWEECSELIIDEDFECFW